jgi:hypothetical protein
MTLPKDPNTEKLESRKLVQMYVFIRKVICKCETRWCVTFIRGVTSYSHQIQAFCFCKQ